MGMMDISALVLLDAGMEASGQSVNAGPVYL